MLTGLQGRFRRREEGGKHRLQDSSQRPSELTKIAGARYLHRYLEKEEEAQFLDVSS